MKRPRRPHLAMLGLFITLTACAAVIVFSARWAFRADHLASSPTDLAPTGIIAATHTADQLQPASLSNRVLTVSLNDDLFPEEIPDRNSPAPQPPKLEVDLIAITGVDGVRSIFAYDRTAKEYFTAAIGDSIPSGPVLIAIEAEAAIFDVAGADVRLELAP